MASPTDIQVWPAPERNKKPILQCLNEVLPKHCRILEIASGTGQHAGFFAGQQPGWQWQPSDKDQTNIKSIEAHRLQQGLHNFLPTLELDVRDLQWPTAIYDAVFCANMIHIAPWEVCVALFAGASRVLHVGGQLILYGPFIQEEVETAPTNVEFDQSLKTRDPRWGLRSLTDVISLGEEHGLQIEENFDMPANNILVTFRKLPGT